MWAKRFDHIERVLLIGLAGFGFWPSALSSALLILALTIRIVRNKGIGNYSLQDWWLFILPVVLFFGWAVGGFAQAGMMELKLWLLWIAILIYFRAGADNDQFKRIFVWMSAAQAATVLIGLLYSINWATPALSYAIREFVDTQFKLHPTYLSALWAWAAILAWMMPNAKLMRYSLSLFLILMATIMGGKMPLLAAALCGLYLWLSNQTISPIKRMSGALLIAIATIGLFLSPIMKERVLELQSLDTDYATNPWLSATEHRLGVWECAWETTLDNWLLGVGIGNSRSSLEACFKTLGNDQFLEGEFNTHNQIMHFWLGTGLIGLFGFLAFFLFAFRKAKTVKDKSLLVFLGFFFLICLTENYLSRQTGMMLFALFAAHSLNLRTR